MLAGPSTRSVSNFLLCMSRSLSYGELNWWKQILCWKIPTLWIARLFKGMTQMVGGCVSQEQVSAVLPKHFAFSCAWFKIHVDFYRGEPRHTSRHPWRPKESKLRDQEAVLLEAWEWTRPSHAYLFERMVETWWIPKMLGSQAKPWCN